MKKFIHQLFAILMVLVMLFDAVPVAVLAEDEDIQPEAVVTALAEGEEKKPEAEAAASAEGENTKPKAEGDTSVESGNAAVETNPVSRGGQLNVEKANYHLLKANEYTVISVTGSFDRFLDPNYILGSASQAEETRGLSEEGDSAASAGDTQEVQKTQALASSAMVAPMMNTRSIDVVQTKAVLGSDQLVSTKGVETESVNSRSLTPVSDGESAAEPKAAAAVAEPKAAAAAAEPKAAAAAAEPKASEPEAPAAPTIQEATGLVAYEIELNDGVPFAKEYDYKVQILDVDKNILEGVEEKSGQTIKIDKVDYRLFHIHGETEKEISKSNFSVNRTDGTITDFSFTTTDFSTFVLVYTVEYHYTDNEAAITLDFTGFEPYSEENASRVFKYDTEECVVRATVEDVLKVAQTEGVAADSNAQNFEINFKAIKVKTAEGGVALAKDGSLVISADGTIVLTEGVKTLTVTVAFTKLKETLLEAAGVTIDVEQGKVPLGSKAQYTPNGQARTAELAEMVKNNLGEEEEEAAGYRSADLRIVLNDKEVPAEGRFTVALEKSSLIPAGMKLEKLYHIHGGEVEELAVKENTDGQLVFALTNFSDIVAGYTVDFEYNGYKWSFPGTGRYAIAEIMSEIGVEGTITDVQLARTIDVGGADNALYLCDDHTELVSDVAFQDTFELTVKVQQTVEEETVEKTYVIVVTDDAPTYNISLEYQEGISLSGVYLIAKQEEAHVNNSNYESGTGTATQYFIQSLNNQPSTIGAGTFYAAYWGYNENPYDENEPVTIYLATSSNGQAVDPNGLINNQGAGYTYYYNGQPVNGYAISINTQVSPATVTIGNTGPISYTASIAFTEDGEPVSGSADLGSGTNYYLLAKVGDAIYHAQITGSVNPVVFQNSEDVDQTSLDLTDSAAFKLATTIPADSTAFDTLTNVTNWNGYTVTAPTGATAAGVYAFSAAKTTPTYTAAIPGTDFIPNDVAGYYLLAKNGSEYRYYAPLGNLSALKDASNTDATGMKNVDSFEIVKFSGEATMAALSAASVAKLGTGCTVGKSGGFYTVTFQNAPDDSNVYQFTATKQADATVTLTFQDTSGNTVSGVVTPNGIYYLVAKLNNQYAFYARVNGTDKNLTFYDDTHTPTNLPYDVGDNYVFVKTPSEVNSLAALSSSNEVDYLETTDGKRYELQDTNSPARVAKAKVVDYTATISGLDNASYVTDYYLLAKEGSAYKYFAPLSNLTSYTDGNGTSPAVMQDVNGFDIVKYTGSETPTLSDLSALTPKLGTGCTVGQPGAYYWINFPTEAIPTEANSSDVYAFTAVKQAEASVSLTFKDTTDTEVSETVALDGTYYIVASLNGERAFYAPVTGSNGPLTFYAADGNGVTENKLPQGVNQAYEIVKVSGTVSNLAGLASGDVVSTMATEDGTTEYYLYATGAPALAAREVDINAPLGDTHTTTVRFFDSNVVWSSGDGSGNGTGTINTDATDQIVPDPALEKYYYVLATIEKTTDAGSENKRKWVYWAVKPINLMDMTESSASVTFNAFQTMEVVNGQTQASAEGVHFLDSGVDTVITRLIHSDIPLNVSDFNCVIQDDKYMLSTAVEGANLSDQAEDGYRFATGWSGRDSMGQSANEIHLYQTENHNRYKIRLRFDPGSDQPIHGEGNGEDQANSKYYYVMAEIKHANSGTSYAYANVEIPNPSALTNVDDDGYPYIDYEFANWYNYDGTPRTDDSFTGHEQGIEVRFVRCLRDPERFKPEDLVNSGTWEMKANAGQIYNETDEMGSYSIHYDTRDSRHSNAYYKEEGDNNTVWSYDVINLTSKSASSDYDYTTILGPNLIYGIVAEHLYQPNHLQTNFAVNHFSGHGHDIRPDLSGNSAGNIVIAEFNESDGSCRNSVGAVAYDPVWGRAKIGKPLKGTLFAYVDDDSGDPTGSVYDNPDQTVVVKANGADLSANIVEPGIEYGKRMSAELLTKPATLSAEISAGKAVIDATGFGEYDTIYVDGDLLVGYIGTTGGLEIKKKDHQTIVFNFDNRSTSRNITINRFTVIQDSFKQYGYPDGRYSTESPEATGSDQNKVMDDIARHIVWNLAECTRKVTIDTAGGIFLQPNDDSEIEIKGTTAGWIVSDGYVYNGTAEWHNVFEEMPESVSVTLTALKTVDGKVPKLADKFSFKLEKLDFTHYQTTGKVNTYNWRQLDVKTNNLAQVQFDTIQQDSGELQVGWNIFRISEIGPHADNTGHFITDTSVYYAAVLVRVIVDAQEKTDVIHYYVDQPRYYTSFDVNKFQPFKANEGAFNPVLTGMGDERVAIPTFRNETVTTGLTLMKRVEGTDLTNKRFKFRVKLWTEDSEGKKLALTDTPITVNGRSSITLTTVTEGSDSWSTFDISLKNGQKVTFRGLTEHVHYEFTEIKVGEKDINNTNADADGYIDGYKPLTFTDDGQGNITYAVSGEIVNVNAATAQTFVNEYKARGEIELDVNKVLQEKQLLANMFAFTLTGGQAPIVGYNDANGNVTFPALPDGKLHFNQSDMAGATKNEDGYLVKEITYVLREGKGTAAEPDVNTAWGINDFSYENVVYDDEKAITLVLTDKGNGTITVHPKNTRDTVCEVNFNNTYKEKGHTHFEGSKVLEGRPITKAEFAFDAVLTSIDGTPVPTDAQITEAGTDDEREALEAQRIAMLAKVSSARVIGTNAAKATPDTEGGHTYTATITFPEIYFSAAGTYVYTITENTGSMPADVQQQANSTTSYTATITVTEQDGKLVAGDPVVYSPDSMTFTNETKTISFNVTKVWLDSNGISASGSKFITFSVMYNGTMLTATQLSSMVITCTGSVELDGNNVKLISNDSGEWPIARFSGVPAGRYVIQEVSHTPTTNGTLRTTYAVVANGAASGRSTNIVRDDGDTLTITNKETKDTYTNITIQKKWKAGTTEYVPTEGSVTLQLWEKKIVGGEPASGARKIKVTVGNTQVYKNGDKDGDIGDYIEINATGTLIDSSTNPHFTVTYYTDNFSGSTVDGGKVETVSRTPADGIFVFRIPINDVSYVSEATTTPTISMKLEIGGLNGSQITSAEIKSSSTEEDILVNSVTLSNENNWTWTKTRLPVSQQDGEITYKYYIKETSVPTGFAVTYSPAGSIVGQSGFITNAGSATLTATNTQETVNKKVVKAWKPDGVSIPEGTTIQLSLYAGTNAAAAAASTLPVRTITLNGEPDTEAVNNNQEAPAWQANFNALPKYDTAGNELVYIVKETQGADGFIVKYSEDGTATYVLASNDDTAAADVATITNEQGHGALKLRKIVTVNGKGKSQWGDDEGNCASLVDGAYLFSITSAADATVRYVWIYVKNGVMNGYRVFTDLDDIQDNDSNPNGCARSEGESTAGWWYSDYGASFKTVNVNGNWVTLDNLIIGQYEVKELDGYAAAPRDKPNDLWINEHAPLNNVVLQNVTNGNGTQGDLSDHSITLTVAPGEEATAEATFTNNRPYITYTPKITKSFTGTWPTGRSFEFTLAMPSTYTAAQLTMPNPLTATATSAGTPAAFGNIIFYAGGTYNFTITETVPSDAVNAAGTTYSAASPKTGWFVKDGIAYDATPVTMSVTVTDNDGLLSVTNVTYGGTAATGDAIATASGRITNKSVETEENAEGAKTLTGRDWKENEFFTFTLTPESTTAALIGTKVILPAAGTGYTVSNNVITVTAGKPATGNTQSFSFPNITFKAPGQYVFTMQETAGNAAHMAYATNTVTVTYTVTMNAADGTLSVARAYSPTGTPAFTNTYTDSETTSFTVQKTLAGGTTEKTFTFYLKQVDANNSTRQVFTKLAETKTATITVSGTTPTATSDFNGTTVTFNQDDIGKDFWFLIEEDAADVDSSGVKDGVKYDTTLQHWIKVSVTLNEQDELVVTKYQSDGTTVITSAPDAAFTNTELTSLSAKKVWTQNGEEMTGWPAGRTVTFQLQSENNGTWTNVTADALGNTIEAQTINAQTQNATVTFSNLRNDLTYRIIETMVDNVSVQSGQELVATGSPLTIANPIDTTTVTVTKAWRKADGTTIALPPAGTEIVLGLYTGANHDHLVSSVKLNGIPEVAENLVEGQEVYPNGNAADHCEDREWHAQWTNLPVYDATDGSAITYVVKETTGAYGYTVRYNNGVNQFVSTTGTITNTLNETDIKVVKIEANSSPQKLLSGASFTLEKGTTTTTTNEQGTTTTTAWAAYSDSTNLSVKTTGDTGEIAFKDLLDGFYRLVETQAPAGYNSISTPIYFKIEGGTVTWTNEQGQTISTQALVTYTPANTDPATFTVGNTPGVVLPATGGPGTLVYTVTGLTLTLGAALWLILRRKREQN